MEIVILIFVILETIGNIGLLICIPIIIKFIYYRKEWHIYYRSIFSSLVVAFIIHGLSSIIIFIVIFKINYVPVLGTEFELVGIYSVTRLLLKGSCGTVRICIWIMGIERTVATIKKKNYEDYNSYIFILIIIVTPFAYGFNIDNIGNAWPFFRKNYVNFCIAFDCTILIVFIILLVLNRKLHQLHHKKMLTLSEKFQVAENIRLTKISLPVSILFVLDNYAFNIIFNIYTLTPTEDEIITLINYGSLAYCYICFFIFILYQYKERLNLQYRLGRNKVLNLQTNDPALKTSDNSQKNNGSQSLKIINANNTLIPMDYDQKSYFKVYANVW
ncbi:7TM GPCR, serpentine receptor class e (Sre) family-containing protein [Strongyloides ratti]|uniref:7TM GPCR, serpentine receptor class e (Sre) family-containing protein n=1 Tax=Strongyloides ratti TaxID=34506 RepID=A0A090N075_STRRB|nr:7TM GPCR, serpentine receptor class e (Sre) family-containing protein [Strongyloides ratti]CEF70195.1 7TM GPCR, serpentine receptor class e (Sre) family-containing protein [Strongyloides ratti]